MPDLLKNEKTNNRQPCRPTANHAAERKFVGAYCR